MNFDEPTAMPVVIVIFFALVLATIVYQYKNRTTNGITKKDLGWLYYNRSHAIRSRNPVLRAVCYLAAACLAILKGNSSSLEKINFIMTPESLANLLVVAIVIICFEFIYRKRVKSDKDWGPGKRWY